MANRTICVATSEGQTFELRMKPSSSVSHLRREIEKQLGKRISWLQTSPRKVECCFVSGASPEQNPELSIWKDSSPRVMADAEPLDHYLEGYHQDCYVHAEVAHNPVDICAKGEGAWCPSEEDLRTLRDTLMDQCAKQKDPKQIVDGCRYSLEGRGWQHFAVFLGTPFFSTPKGRWVVFNSYRGEFTFLIF